MKTTITTHSPQQTQEFATFLARLLKGNEIIFLEGNLGAGKTTFTQGLAKGLNIRDNVNSPTFTLMKIYHGDHPLVHIDAYRLEGIDQDLGFEDYFDGEHIVIIEWANFIQDQLETPDIKIQIHYIDQQQRQIEIEADAALIEELNTYGN